jgi:hypothetical protein
MTTETLGIDVVCFSLTLWLGAYLLSRDPSNLRLLLTAVALVTVGLGWAIEILEPAANLPPFWPLLVISAVLFLLGLAVATLSALDQREMFLPDILRSLDGSLAVGILFGGQVLATILLVTGPSVAMRLLLLGTIAAAIAVVAFGDALQSLVDTVAFPLLTRVRKERAELRAAAAALPRANPAFDVQSLDEDELARLTRRALSHFGDLAHLASCPLIYVPLVDERLAARRATDNPIERAIELKEILAESIARLKPRGQGDFGTSDEWRYYNALYFPYVVGLKLYRQRTGTTTKDPTLREALTWFRDSVPERTLYNWQTTGARLVASDLRARSAPKVVAEGN